MHCTLTSDMQIMQKSYFFKCRYIKWIKQTYPQGGKESNLSVLLDRAVTRFTADKKYHNDVRYIELWIEFVSDQSSRGVFRWHYSVLNMFVSVSLQAEGCSDPMDVYRYMQAQGIGTMQAAFYIAWSEEYEKRGNIKMADSVFQDGIKCGADPVEKLHVFHRFGSFQLIFSTFISICERPPNDQHNQNLAVSRSTPCLLIDSLEFSYPVKALLV